MDILLRIGIFSRSLKCVISTPCTETDPLFGFQSPRMIFRSELFPAPLGPRITFVSPFLTSKETSSRIFRSSTSTVTCSTLIILKNRPDHFRENEIIEEHDHRRHDDCIHGSPSDTHGSAGGGESVIAADCRNKEGEDDRFRKTDNKILHLQIVNRGVPVKRRIDVQPEVG